jgi:nitrite reductase (NO-forming)
LGKKIDGRPLYVLDTENLKKAISSHTVFNGQLNGMVKEPLKSKPGERVRLFVLNVGPSKTSSFHVVGTIFDRVWMDGNPDNQLRGMQTVLLGASSAAIVEMMIPEHGKYLMLDHQFADASQGAIGVIATSSEKLDTPEPIEHNNMAASDLPEDQSVIRGKNDFESKCLACHSIGQGKRLGPDLAGVTKRHTDEWIARWLTSPEAMLAKDPTAIALLKEYNNIPMPNQNLQSTEIKQYIQYFHWADSKILGVVNKGSK